MTAVFRNPVQKSSAKLITRLDVAWVVASVVVVVVFFSAISVAAWVGMMAFLQHKAL